MSSAPVIASPNMPPPANRVPAIPSYPALIRFAVPVMLAAMATPLMGMVDTAVLGRLGDPAVIAAAGIGGTMFTVIYWCFAFLRFTTTALVSQAIGRHDRNEVLLAGLRPMLAAVVGGIALWLLQWPIAWVGLRLLEPPAAVLPLAHAYFNVRIWSAPLTLLGYAQFAWLMGQGRARTVMLLQVALNALNAALASLFVLGFNGGITGAAKATVTSEACICLVTTALMLRMVPIAQWYAVRMQVLAKTAWRTLFSANVDITIRTLLLTGSFALMTERGARMGLMDLAANQILMQAFLLVANLLDGFATAAEVFGGRAVGAGSRAALVKIVRRSAALSLGWSLLLAAVLCIAKPWYLDVMTSNMPLQETAAAYWPWVAGLPVICIWAFLWDGVFMSAMRTRTLRNTMLLSVLVYVPSLFVLSSLWGNHGIWAALVVLMACRSLFLTLAWPKLKNAVGYIGGCDPVCTRK
jgi:MATE family multidrug resistance protein